MIDYKVVEGDPRSGKGYVVQLVDVSWIGGVRVETALDAAGRRQASPARPQDEARARRERLAFEARRREVRAGQLRQLQALEERERRDRAVAEYRKRHRRW